MIIRGVRSLTDMEAEFTMTLANRKLDADIETVFLMADDEFSHVSSSLIKQITPLASDEELARFVPRAIIPDLRAKLAELNMRRARSASNLYRSLARHQPRVQSRYLIDAASVATRPQAQAHHAPAPTSSRSIPTGSTACRLQGNRLAMPAVAATASTACRRRRLSL